MAVAERCHVTRAARELGLTQSAVSSTIATLETRHGAKLFDRIGRGIELTDAGKRFLPEARAVLDRAAAAQSVLEDLSGVPTGVLSIAASQTIASYWLPRRLTTFHERYPSVRLDVTIGNTRHVEMAVIEGAADLGLVEGETTSDALLRSPVDRDRLVLVMASHKPSPPKLKSGRVDLAAVPWVVREAGSGTRAVLEHLAERDGIGFDRLPIFLVLPSNEAVREAVEAGAGATVISEHVVARDLAAGLLKSIPIDLPPREFAIVRHRGRHANAAQLALAEILREGFDPENAPGPAAARRRRRP